MLSWLLGPIGRVFGALGMLLALLAGAYLKGRSAAKKEGELDALKESKRRFERGQDAVRAGRESGDTPAERVRKNDGSW